MTSLEKPGRDGVVVARRTGLGVTLLELIIVLAIIGILLAMLFPALMAMHQHALRTDCESHLHQLQIGLSTYVDVNRSFVLPPPDDNYPGGWSIAILPYIEETALANMFDVDQPLTSPRNLAAAARRPYLFVCPVMPENSSTMKGVGITHYLVVVDAKTRTQDRRRINWYIKEAPKGSRNPWCSSPEILPEDAAYPPPHPTAFGF